MKTRRILCILLAVLLLGGAFSLAGAALPAPGKSVSLSAGAAPAPDQAYLKVATPPDNIDYILGYQTPDPTGLVLTVLANNRTFDITWGEPIRDDDYWRYYFELSIDPDNLPRQVGDGVEVTVQFKGWEEILKPGYGWTYYDYYTEIKIPFNAKSPLDLMKASAALTLEVPLDTELNLDLDGWDPTPSFFQFTVPADGLYMFQASDCDWPAPFGFVLDDAGKLFGRSDNLEDSPVFAFLAAGTYYLAVDFLLYLPLPTGYKYEVTLLATGLAIPALTLGTAAKAEVKNGIPNYMVFEPAADGWYTFRSKAAYGVDPRARLFDDKMEDIGSNDDGRTMYIAEEAVTGINYGLDFNIAAELKGGKKYLLVAGLYGAGDSGDYEVTVKKSTLTGPASYKLRYKQPVRFQEIYSSNFDAIDVKVEGGAFGWIELGSFNNKYYDYCAARRGTAKLTALAPDGTNVVTTVQVDYSFWQWLLVIFLFGWAWY